MFRWGFLIALLLFLWLPILQMITGFSEHTLKENRKLVPAPELKSWADIDEYVNDTVKWFNDNFGFRDILIRAKTQFDYSVFGMSTHVHVGQDGWLYYRSVMDVQKPQVELNLRKNADLVLNGTRNLAKQLKKRGIKLIVMIAPMKDVYYSAYLPDTAKQVSPPRQIDILQEKLKELDDIIFLDSKSILEKLSRERYVFHKTDFHWNDPAAFEVAKQLVNQLGAIELKPKPVWTHKLQIEKRNYSGGIASFMPIFFPPREKGLFVKQSWVQPTYIYEEKQGVFDWVNKIKNPTENELLPIAVIGDSFFDGMVRSGISMYFKKIYRSSFHKTSIKDIVNNLPNDIRYLFVEFIEVGAGFNELKSFN